MTYGEKELQKLLDRFENMSDEEYLKLYEKAKSAEEIEIILDLKEE